MPAKKKTPAKKTATPPPPAAKKLPPPPPPPPPLQKRGQTEFASVVAGEKNHLKVGHPQPPKDATHFEFVHEGGGTFIVGPAKAWIDFETTKGTMRYGRLVDEDGYHKGQRGSFVYSPGFEPPQKSSTPPAELNDKTNAAGADGAPAPQPRAPRAPGAGKREGVCAFIDATIMEGGRTAEQILEIVMAKFPGRDPKATLSTIRCRPSHIKKAGQTPPPFAK